MADYTYSRIYVIELSYQECRDQMFYDNEYNEYNECKWDGVREVEYYFKPHVLKDYITICWRFMDHNRLFKLTIKDTNPLMWYLCSNRVASSESSLGSDSKTFE